MAPSAAECGHGGRRARTRTVKSGEFEVATDMELLDGNLPSQITIKTLRLSKVGSTVLRV